jgi:hypothetical protein
LQRLGGGYTKKGTKLTAMPNLATGGLPINSCGKGSMCFVGIPLIYRLNKNDSNIKV